MNRLSLARVWDPGPRAIAFDSLRPSLRRTKPSRRPKLDHRGRKPTLRPRPRAGKFHMRWPCLGSSTLRVGCRTLEPDMALSNTARRVLAEAAQHPLRLAVPPA